MMYLEFDVLEDYLSHIRELMPCQTRAGLKTLAGKSSGKFDTIVGVTVYAVFTQNCGNYIALCSCRVGKTTNHHIEYDKESNDKILLAFEEIKAFVLEQGFQIHPGIWKITAPTYLL